MIETTRIDGRPKNVNTGTFTNKGIEFDSRYQILKNLSLDMNYSYLHTSKALLAAPAHKFFAGVMYAPGRFHFQRERTIHFRPLYQYGGQGERGLHGSECEGSLPFRYT